MSTCAICLSSESNALMLTAINLNVIKLMTKLYCLRQKKTLSVFYIKIKEVKKVNKALYFLTFLFSIFISIDSHCY